MGGQDPYQCADGQTTTSFVRSRLRKLQKPIAVKL